MADIEADTLFTYSLGKGLYIFSEGPVGGLPNGSNSVYLNDVPLVDQNGVSSAEGVSWTWRGGTPDQAPVDGIPAAVSFQNVGVEVKQGVPYAVTIANGSDNYDAAYVVVGIPRLVFTSAKGNLRKTRLEYAIDVKTSTGSWVTQHAISMDAKASAQWEGTYRVELPAGGSPWQVRLRRITANADDGPRPNGETYDNRTRFERYATITDGRFNYRNTALLGIQYDSKKYGTSIPNVKVLMDGIKCYVPKNYNPVTRVYATTGTGTSGGIWDGTFKQEVTDNPFWIYHDLIVNNRYGLGQDFNPNNTPESAFVDKWALYSLGQYADEMVDDGKGGQEPRFTLNTQITNKGEAYDLLQNVIASANGMLYFSADQVVAVADRPQSVSDAFTQADVEGGFFEYSGTALRARHSVCIVNYRDPDNLYKTSNVVYEDGDYIDEIGYRSTEITAFGCTSRAQAMRLAKWTLRTERTQTQTVTFKTGHRGGLLKPGDVIKVFDDYKTGTRTGGRILSSAAATNTTFTLDAPVTVTNADKILYMDATGTLQEFSLLASTGNNVTVSGSKPLPIDGAMFAIVYASLDGQQYRILSVEESQDDGKYIVSGLLHDPQKFAFVDDNVIIAPPVTSVLTADALSPITVANSQTYFEEISGAQVTPKATFSWQPPKFSNSYPVAYKRNQLDERVSSYELQFKTPWDDYKTVYNDSGTSWTSGPLEIVPNPSNIIVDPSHTGPVIDPENPLGYKYGARVRSIDQLGRRSAWYEYNEFYVDGKTTAPAPVTNLVATPVINGVALSWDNPIISAFKHVSISVNIVDDPLTATKIAEISDDFYILSNIVDNDIRYFYVTVYSHNPLEGPSTVATAFAARTRVTAGDVDETVGFIETVDGLPDPVTWTGSRTVYDTVSGSMYRLVGDSWVPIVGSGTPTDVTIGAPTGLSLSSALTTDAAQQTYINLTASWSAPSDVTNLGFYELELQEASGPLVIFNVSSLTYTRLVRPNTLYSARVRAVSKTATRSSWTSVVTHTSTVDTTPPSVPTALAANVSIGSVFLTWTNPSANDLDRIEVYENTSNSSGTATRIAVVNAQPSQAGGFTRSGLSSGNVRYYWLKAVDTSGNTSGFSTGISATIPAIPTTELDTTPPAVPTGLTVNSVLTTDGTGNPVVTIVAAWTANAESDLSGYEIEIIEGSGNPFVTVSGNNRFSFLGRAGVVYNVRVRAFDGVGNKSAYTSTVSATGAADTTPPNAPTGLVGYASFGSIYLNATSPSNSDVAAVEFFENTTNNSGTAASIGIVNAFPSSLAGITRSGLTPGTTLYYWAKAIDYSGNKSAFSTGTNVTVPKIGVTDFASSISPVELFASNAAAGTPTLGRTYFNTTDKKLYRGTGTEWTAAVAGPDIVANSITAGQIAAGAISATEIAANAITTDKIGANQITAAKIAAGTITATQIQAGSISGDRFITNTSLPGTITVGATGVTIGTVQDQAANPAGVINGGTTRIDPGLILISGSTYLSDWRQGGDATRIAGGVISANTITANKLTIGNRGISINGCDFEYSGNTLYWRAGYVIYPDNNGTIQTAAISAGSTTYPGSGYRYISWTQGATSFVASTDDWSAIMGSGNKIIMCTWSGGPNFVANYGGTIVHGDNITTGSINAVKIVAQSITATQIAANTITASQIAAGTITATQIQAGSISGDRISTTTSLPGTITVGSTGVTIATVQGQAANPAAVINGGSTRIDPGLILISGSTYLSNWRQGGDETRIAGGNISANTITANKLKIGDRNISILACDFEYNPTNGRLYWSSGYVLYTNDSGASAAASIAAGSINYTSSTYIYWPKGASQFYAGVDNWDTIIAGDNVLMCSWTGGPNFIAHYGGTLINGDRITTNTINANRIVANSITATQIAANAITADKLTIASRGIQVVNNQFYPNNPGTNQVAWTGGGIAWQNDSGGTTETGISGGSASWSSGTLYIYWVKGASSLSSTTNSTTANGVNNVVLATYSGGTNLNVYNGRTTITADGIVTPSLAAISANLGAITGGSLNIGSGRFQVASDGSVTIQSASSGARLVLTNSVIEVYDASNVRRVRLGIW